MLWFVAHIGKIWEVDPLGCPQCGHEMKIIGVIYETDFIERILRQSAVQFNAASRVGFTRQKL